jgi:oligopeptide/dipeptide ABC transporter ATP-binding protein
MTYAMGKRARGIMLGSVAALATLTGLARAEDIEVAYLSASSANTWLAASMSSRIAVMYLGSIVEIGAADAVFERPSHPYTQALISAVPKPATGGADRKRIILTGDVPSPTAPPSGCAFHPRCPMAQDRCRSETPKLKPGADARSVACHFPIG